MSKRKEIDEKKKKRFEGEEESSSDEDDVLNVDFEFFAPQAAWDFHGLKILLRQLFDNDAHLMDLSGLAELILDQPTLGSTVKVESMETDPYAFLSILNLKAHKDKPAIKTLTDYIVKRAGKNQALTPIVEVLTKGDAEVGLILTERLLNMPVEIAPPMYKMLHEEITWAVEDNEPYRFTHYLLLSKTYREVESKLDQEADRPRKKQRGEAFTSEVFYFHPEDPTMHNYAAAFGDYPLVHEAAEGDADSKRTFQDYGIRPQGHMILIESSKFEDAFQALQEAFAG